MNRSLLVTILAVVVSGCSASNENHSAQTIDNVAGYYDYHRSFIDYRCDKGQQVTDTAHTTQIRAEQSKQDASLQMYDMLFKQPTYTGTRTDNFARLSRTRVDLVTSVAMTSTLYLNFTDTGFAGEDKRTVHTSDGNTCLGTGVVTGQLIERFRG